MPKTFTATGRHISFHVPTMKSPLTAYTLSLFLLFVSCFAGAQEVVVNDSYLEALAMIESGGNHKALGKAGERGAWQIKTQAWRYTSELRVRQNLEAHPFSAAANEIVARAYVKSLLEDHSARFANEHGRKPTPAELYAIWNLGFDGFRRRGSLAKCPPLTRDAAQRLTNLFRKLSSLRMVTTGG